MSNSIVNKIFDKNLSFNEVAAEIFSFQYNNNAVYMNWCDLLHVDAGKINSIQHIPFLPVSFFKTHKVICGDENFDTFLKAAAPRKHQKANII